MKTLSKIIGLLLVVVLVSSCKREVTRVSPDQQIDLSGRWNDTDSKLVAEEMIQDVLLRPWLGNFSNAEGRKPVVIVGMIQNRTSEHIESETFIKDLEKEFINSGTIRVVENDLFREKLREERADQNEFASVETQSQWGLELGADFMLFGVMTSITDELGREKVVSYKWAFLESLLQTTKSSVF